MFTSNGSLGGIMNYILVYNNSTGVLKSLKPLFSMEEYGLIEVKSFQEMKWQVRT